MILEVAAWSIPPFFRIPASYGALKLCASHADLAFDPLVEAWTHA